MDRKEIVKTYFSLMAAAWVMHLRPRLELETLDGSPTLTVHIACFMWPFVDANILTLFTLLSLLMLPQTNSLKWIFVVAFFLQCIWCCIESTVLNLVELETLPSMLEAVNYFPIHAKMIFICGLQLLAFIEMGFVFCYTLEYEN